MKKELVKMGYEKPEESLLIPIFGLIGGFYALYYIISLFRLWKQVLQ